MFKGECAKSGSRKSKIDGEVQAEGFIAISKSNL